MSLLGRDEIHGDVRAYIPGIYGRHVQPVLVLRSFGPRSRRDRRSQNEDQRTGKLRKVSISKCLSIQNGAAAITALATGN